MGDTQNPDKELKKLIKAFAFISEFDVSNLENLQRKRDLLVDIEAQCLSARAILESRMDAASK